MKQIPAIDKQTEVDTITDHPSVIHGYRQARGLDLDLMIIPDHGLFPDEVPAIIESLRKHNIEQVALTDSSSALMGILWEFTKAGATFEMDLIDTGKEETFYSPRNVPGFVITVN